jgi:hypothetical protein
MITLVIIAVVSALGINALVSNLSSTAVTTAADELASFVKQARSYAVTQGCKTRIIICADKHCAHAADTLLVGGFGSPSFVGTSANSAARYYGLLIQSKYCAAADANSLDGYSFWDFDKNPLGSIPVGVVFSAIYTGNSGTLDSSDGTDTGSSVTIGNSIYFSPDLNPSTGTIPVTNGHTPIPASQTEGNTIVFQLRMEHCNPATSDDCLGYFVTISPGGVTGIQRCISGGRTTDYSTKCF